MIKKILFTSLLTLSMIFCTAGCGNRQLIDLTYTYDYAIVRLPNGEVVEGKLQSWKDYDGEQLQVKINGKTYLTNSFDCVLIAD